MNTHLDNGVGFAAISLLTGIEVAQILNVSRSFAYLLMERGEIPTVKIGRLVRVRPIDLESYIAANVRGNSESAI